MPARLHAAAVALFKSDPSRCKWITAARDQLQVNGEYVNQLRKYAAPLYKDQAVVFLGFARY